MIRFLQFCVILGLSSIRLSYADDTQYQNVEHTPFDVFSDEKSMIPSRNEASTSGIDFKSQQPLDLAKSLTQANPIKVDGLFAKSGPALVKSEPKNEDFEQEKDDIADGIVPSKKLLLEVSSSSVSSKLGLDGYSFNHVFDRDESGSPGNDSPPVGGDEKDEESVDDSDWYHNPGFDEDVDDNDQNVGNDNEKNVADDGDQFPWPKSDEDDKDKFDDDDEESISQYLEKISNGKGSVISEDEEDEDYGDKFPQDMMDDDEDMIKKSKPPTAPTNMVLFYTWMILAILIMVVVVSTYQAKCKGMLARGSRQQQPRGEDRKRLLDNEFV